MNWGNNERWRTLNHNFMQWHTGDPKRSKFQFMEYDGGSNTTKTVSYSDSGVPCSYSFSTKSGDDNCGSMTFHKDDTPRTKSWPYSTGDVKFTVE